MKARKTQVRKSIAGLAVIVAVQAGIAGANVTVTGERTGTSPLPSLNVPLNEIAYATGRSTGLQFTDPSTLTGETITLPGGIDQQQLPSPSLVNMCLPNLDRQCRHPEIAMWSSPVDFSLRLSLPNASSREYLSARRETKQVLESQYGIDAFSADSPVNARHDGLQLGKLEVYAGDAL
jgi:hypothetical protein